MGSVVKDMAYLSTSSSVNLTVSLGSVSSYSPVRMHITFTIY